MLDTDKAKLFAEVLLHRELWRQLYAVVDYKKLDLPVGLQSQLEIIKVFLECYGVELNDDRKAE